MIVTRRRLVRDVAFSAAVTVMAGSFKPWAAAAETRYGHYFKKLAYRKAEGGPGGADYFVRLNGKDLEGRNTNFAFGYYSKVGAWNTAETAGHAHTFDECLVFAGLEPKDPNYLGAEVEISLGKENERYVIDVPSIVCIPRNLQHGPITTKKVEKPFAHYSIGLAGDYQTTQSPAKTTAPSSQKEYAHLIKQMSASAMGNSTKVGPGNADWLTWPKGKGLEGFIVNFTWGFYSGLGSWHSIPGFDPHVHEGDEFLVFVGLDANKPTYLGAQIELHMGKEEEIHMIETPLVAICPSMFTHAPIITQKVDKPYAFFLIRTDTGETYSPKKRPV